MSDLLRLHIGSKRSPPPWEDIKFRCAFTNTIYDVLKARGFKESDSEMEWDIFWADKEWIHDCFDHIHLMPKQKVNHFRNHFELTRKDLMVKNIKRAQRQAQKDGQPELARKFEACSPQTFVLPMEYSMFVEEFKLNQPQGAIWIMKPVGKSQGKGIFLFDKLHQISGWKQVPLWLRNQQEEQQQPAQRRAAAAAAAAAGGAAQTEKDDEEKANEAPEPYVVQRYLSDPLLVGGKKFDLRLYVLVTSYTPLTVYMYRSGFARFSHARFSMDAADLADAQIHLTNVAVQKHNEHYDAQRGGKWELHSLKQYLLLCHEDPSKVHDLFWEMEEIILFSLLAVQKVIIQDKHCFELYGYDIMISSDLKPWLIEVNASPSLTANTSNDYEMKFNLLDDLLTVLDLEKYLRGDEQHIGGFDILYRHGARRGPPPGSAHRAYLGCHNDRRQNIEYLARRYAEEDGLAAGDSSPSAFTSASSLGPSPGGAGASPSFHAGAPAPSGSVYPSPSTFNPVSAGPPGGGGGGGRGGGGGGGAANGGGNGGPGPFVVGRPPLAPSAPPPLRRRPT